MTTQARAIKGNCENQKQAIIKQSSNLGEQERGPKQNMHEIKHHRRRRETEDKSKVVASVWGAKCVQFLAALAVLTRSIYKKRMNPTASSNSTEAKQLSRQGIEQMLPPKQTRRPLPCLLPVIISFFYDMSSKSSHILYICSAALFATRSEFLCGHSDYFQDSVHTTCELSTSLS